MREIARTDNCFRGDIMYHEIGKHQKKFPRPKEIAFLGKHKIAGLKEKMC